MLSRHFGTKPKNVSLFSILAHANLSNKNKKTAYNYFLLISDLDKERGNVKIIKKILEKGNRDQQELLNEILFKNPFVNNCNCKYCNEIYPKQLYKIFESFYI